MTTSLQKLYAGTLFFLAVCLLGVVGYALAGWDLVDSVYMVVITIYGVGYGEVQPISHPLLKLFTILVIVAGCSSGIYVVGAFVQMIAEGEIKRAIEARRMTKGIEKLSNHIIVCGYGHIGTILAAELHESRQTFVVIDQVPEKTQAAEEAGYFAVLGNATEEKTLLAAGVQQAKVLATVLTEDAMNVFVTLTAHELNPHLEIIARAEKPSTEKKLLHSGAKRVIVPAAIGASKLASIITRPSAEDLLVDQAGKDHLHEELRAIGLQMIEFPIAGDSPLVGGRIQDLEISGIGGFVIVALRKPDGVIHRNPPASTVISADETLIVLGHKEDMPQLLKKAGPKSELSYRGVKVT